MILWLTLDHFFFIITSWFSREKLNSDDIYGTWWHDGMTMIDGLLGGILPSWEGVLKLATRAKFQLRTTYMMEMIIALDSSFREVEFWYKDHLILTNKSGILNLFSLMHKLSKLALVK